MGDFQVRAIGGLRGIFKAGPPQSPCVVLFHGYGADADDLAPLSEYMQAGPKFNWFFPQGIQAVPIGPMSSGRAWFPIDIEELDRATREGRPRELADKRPAGLDSAASQAGNCLQALSADFGRVFAGGFSQGAMLVSDVLISKRASADRWIMLSGSPLDYPNWKKQLVDMEKIPIFWSHGRSDPVLPFEVSESWMEDLDAAGFFLTTVSFAGGHEIPDRVLAGLDEFLIEGLR